jgi:hypothetical protein
MGQLCSNWILSTVPLTALLVFLWTKNASDQSRLRLIAGAVAIGSSGLLSRLLQTILPMIGLGRTRPLYDPNLTSILRRPIGLAPHVLEDHSSWPSDSAAWLFGLALLIWIQGWQALRHSSSMYSSAFQFNEGPDGISFPFGYPVRCCACCAHGTGEPEIADSACRFQDSDTSAKMAGRFLCCAVCRNVFAGDICYRSQKSWQYDPGFPSQQSLNKARRSTERTP